jgi:hypothetical protein
MSNMILAILLIVSGVLLSLNSFSLSVFSALLAGSIGRGHPAKTRHIIALNYLSSYWIVLAFVGVVFVALFNAIDLNLLKTIGLALGLLCVLDGLFAIKNYFWNKPHNRVPATVLAKIHKLVFKRNNPVSSLYLGLYSGLGSLLNFGIITITFAAIFALARPTSYLWILLLPLSMLIPLKIIYFLIVNKVKASAVYKWHEDGQAVMKLSFGLIHIAIGWLLLLILNGSIGL